MARTKGRMRDEMHMSLSDVIQSTSVKYDAVPFSIEDDYDTDNDDHPIDMTKSRRWSILDKLERRYYCRVRSCSEFLNILSFKCFFATCMLVFFVLLALTLAHEVLSIDVGGPDRYDFIIVGGGAAGSTIARKLTDSGASVLLLEAGTNTQYDLGGKDYFGGPLTRFDIPFLWPSTPFFSEFKWHGLNLPGVTLGKGVGGSELHSSMTYVRAHPSDISKWNVPGWTWSRVLRTFKGLEKYSGDDAPCPDYHGSDGSIPTTRPPVVDGIGAEFVSSALNSGIPFTPDFNDPEGREGAGYYHFNIKGGARMSAARVMLGPIMKTKSSLRLELGATVKRVILAELPYTPGTTPDTKTSRRAKGSKEEVMSRENQTEDTAEERRPSASLSAENKSSHLKQRQRQRQSPPDSSQVGEYKATGVEYVQNGVTKRVYLKTSIITMESAPFSRVGVRSVILSAGAIMTPMLLMNSGIGPRDTLEEAGVKVLLAAEAVGRNLQNQPAVGVTVTLLDGALAGYPSAYSIASEWGAYVEAVTQDRAGVPVAEENFGILGTVGISAGAFLASPFSLNGVPDLQLTAYPKVIEPHLTSKSDRFSESSTPPEVLLSGNQMLITVTLLTPEARLKVSLNATDPGSGPLITHSCPFREPTIYPLSNMTSHTAHPTQGIAGQTGLIEVNRPRDTSAMNSTDDFDLPSLDPGRLPVPEECVDNWTAENTTDLNSAHYLTDKDLSTLVWGLEQVRRILSFAPLSNLTGREVSPGQDVSSLEDMKLWVRANAYTTSSWVGSAAMGEQGTEGTTVVDESLCVWGVQGLRVTDASVIPVSPVGDVRTTVVMLGAAAAEIVLTEAKILQD